MLVFCMVAFLMIMVPMMVIDAQAFNKHGPTPIPGNLIPFPVMHDKHGSTIPPVMPPTKK